VRIAAVRVAAALLAAALFLASCAAPPSEPRARLALSEALGAPADAGFARATQPRAFVFPQDHGPHPEYAAEWWYFTGNLTSAEGQRFGYQLTFFRFGLDPAPPQRGSAWAASSIYMAHFALSDIDGGRFMAFERLSRGAAGLAGAEGEPLRIRLQAADGATAIDLTLAAGKPAVLQGDRGLSQKSAAPGNASYYYSLTRMPTTGTVRTSAGLAQVSGLSWMDREWSTSALGDQQVGWDWFALQLSDGSELMYYRLRLRDGSDDPYSAGVLVAPDGSARRLRREDLVLTETGRWQSPRGATYPSGWRLQIPDAGLDLMIAPALRDQELPLTVTYWEGAVSVTGARAGAELTGQGYVELTGYADSASADGLPR
jgi:predicted secreted hydrolase